MKLRDLFYSYAVTYAGTVASVLLLVAFYAISLRISTEAFGALQSSMAFMFLLIAGRSAAAGYIVMHAAGNEAALGSIVRRGAWLTLLTSLTIAGAFIAFSSTLRDFLHVKSAFPFMLIGISAIPGLFTAMSEGILNAQKRFGALAFCSIVTPLTNTVLAALLLHDGLQGGDAGWIVLGGQLSGCIIVFFVDWKSLLRSTPFLPMRSSLRDVVELLVASLLFGATLRYDIFWAKHVLSDTAAGSYAIAASIAVILYLISGSVARVASVSMRKGKTGIRVIAGAYALILSVSTLLAGGFTLFGEKSLLILTGKTIPIDWTILTPLFFALTFYSIITFDYTCLNIATKRVHMGIGALLLAAQVSSLYVFGVDGRSVALTHCVLMGTMSVVFSASLLRTIRTGRIQPVPHPAEAHLANQS